MASSRVGFGASFVSINSNGMLEGDIGGVKRVKTMAPAITIEGEIIPFEQFSIFLKADMAPFKPSITSKGEPLPSVSEVVDESKLAGLFSLGLGWQMPISYWAYYDSPFEVTVGGVFSLGWLHLSYDTPHIYFKSNELSLGVGLFESGSFYFGSLGITVTSTQTFSFGDYSTWTKKPTGSDETTDSQYVNTPIIFSWDVSLLMSVRFGY